MDILKWIENWYQSQCDGNWERANGIKIYSAGNPGWAVKIPLEDIDLEDVEFESGLVKGPEVVLVGGHVGDPTKLRFLLEAFRQLVEEHSG